ncbi:transcriptional regulator [Nocardia salmonicida]|uniref:transcriptional regulator n=1 Tax=Nocardia salmonicida TaxID=53431 RepID=UPI00379AC291
MTVIDGVHRLRAAQIREDTHISVRYFDGSTEDAFAIAVRMNVTHGLPLSLSERKTAALWLVGSRPEWSDRLIASTTGLSHRTISAVRQSATGENAQSHSRVGKDGRVRPLRAAEGRKIAAEMIRLNPDASLRQIAKVAGISPGTVKDVRDRMRDCDGAKLSVADSAVDHNASPSEIDDQDISLDVTRDTSPTPIQSAILNGLKNDPALRFNIKGRALLRRLTFSVMDIHEWERILEEAPEHCAGSLARLAHANSQAWRDLAGRLDQGQEEPVSRRHESQTG